MKEQDINSAINELNKIENRKELEYATLTGLIYMHYLCKRVDRDTVQELKFKQEGAFMSASD